MSNVAGGVMVGRLWRKTCDLPKDSVLAVAKATGRATRVAQDSALAAVKGAVRVAVWTNEQAACSAKLLNPLRWAKKHGDRREAREDGPVAVAEASRPSNNPGTVIADAPTPKVPKAGPETPKSATCDLDDVAGSAVQKIVEPESKRNRRSRPGRDRRLPHIRGRGIPPEVTPEEASAATFGGVTAKVMFTRASRDLTSPNKATRIRAARILADISHELSVRALAARLARDPSPEVRKECVNGLTALESKEGLPAVERALSDESGGVRLAAVRGIHRLAGAAGAASLVRMFSDELEDVRRRAAACLGWLGQERLAVELLPLLKDTSPSVRRVALEAVGNLKSLVVLNEVIELLDDPEESVQREAFEVLQTITGKQMAETFPKDEDGRRFLIARWRAWQEKVPSGRER